MQVDRSFAPLRSAPSRGGPRGLGWAAAVLGLLLAGCAATVASPDAYAQEAQADDPPARVGAVSALRGPVDVSAEPGGAWDTAQINQPVTSQTSLFAKPGSQAEVRIGSTSVRLDGNTQAVFSQLDDHAVVIDVAQGTVRARVRSLPGGDSFVLVADNVRAEAQGPGDYRVAYDPDRRAYTVRALAGRMKVVTPGNAFNLEAGQETLVEAGGSALQLRAAVTTTGPRDDFDGWADSRDREQDRLAAARYVSPETTGIEALDANGRWEVVGDYGPVWYPRAVPYGWAPYRHGRWAHVRPWGWTWIDDAPWGFAPFHYGRWAQIGGSWGWVPGPIVPRPVWAPALVGYVGSGGASVSIGIGSGRPVGWFPLGPREVYHPPYRHGPRYRQQVNVINVNTVGVNPPPARGDRRVARPPAPGPGAYRYARQPDAVTMGPRDGVGRMLPRSEGNDDRARYVPAPLDGGLPGARRNDPRFNDDERGAYGRGPQQRPPQFTPAPARTVPPAAAPAPQIAPRTVPAPQAMPRPAPVPQAAPPQAPPQQQAPPRFRQHNNPNRDGDVRAGPHER